MQRAEIAKAILKLQGLTCIQFVPRLFEMDYIYIQKTTMENEGLCGSFIGRGGGEQPVFLSSNCFIEGIILHEFMHVLGFEHEQCRLDRDDFVSIAFENITQSTDITIRITV